MSQIEKSVTHLLVATKQLLETLTQWSRHQATDAQVSDVYVRLGYEFNIACRAFSAINVDTTDLGNVPELLRHILEATLSQEASVESLDKYLPRIRDIIITLLHGLKRKQQKLRQKQQKDGVSQNTDESLPRNSSTSSIGSANTGLTSLLNEGLPEKYRDGSMTEGRETSNQTKNENTSIPPRVSSTSNGSSPNRRAVPPREQSRDSNTSEQSSLSSTTMQNIPVLPPYPGDETPRPPSAELNIDTFPPPPPPKQNAQNALQALQRGPELERRASRRYSQYQISKHLGSEHVPMIPPTQNSPIPNRGRDLRESMNAVRGRGLAHSHQKSHNRFGNEESPNRVPSRILEEHVDETPVLKPPREPAPDDSPTIKTPEDKIRQAFPTLDQPVSATLQSPHTDATPSVTAEQMRKEALDPQHEKPQNNRTIPQRAGTPEQVAQQFVPEQSPQPGVELTLFLQYKTKIKKYVLADGYNDLSIARLQLAFIEKFAWNTHNNGVDLPEIYIQDPVSGVRHELEDLTDIKDRSVLVLNVEVLDEVKRHIDEGIGGLRRIVEGVKIAIDDQQATIQRVSERQQDTAKEMARLATAPPALRTSVIDHSRSNGMILNQPKVGSTNQLSEIQSLRRDLAVLRQTYSNFQSDIESSMSTIRTKASSVKAVALKAAIPDFKGDSGRAYVSAGKKTLSEDSDKLVSQVDDLQDIVEDLRKDVVMRGVRPLPRQLETVAKDISIATMDLKKMKDLLKREQPIWSKILVKELEQVCRDRDELTMQEGLVTDLEDDLEKATQTFALVEEATKEQMKDLTGGTVAARALTRGLNHVPLSDPSAAKEGVLGEVRALQPNHENRLEAIERAEKLRQKELESRRGGEFQKELGDFVEAGKLKKAGGFEEVERARKAKDERIRREVWERQNGMTQADAGATDSPGPSTDESETPVEGAGDHSTTVDGASAPNA